MVAVTVVLGLLATAGPQVDPGFEGKLVIGIVNFSSQSIALVDTGANITCLPKAIINALGAERASTYNVVGINGVSIGPANTYFLEFEIVATKKLVEVIAVGDEPILGRNLINEFMLELHGPTQELSITLGTE